MRVVLVANTLWSIVIFRPGLLRTLVGMGVDVVVMAPVDDTLPRARELNVRVIPLELSAKGTNPLHDLGLVRTLVTRYRALKPDLVFHYTIKPNIYGSIAAKLAGVPCIAVTTGLGYAFVNTNLVARVAKALYRFAFCFPREVWFLNGDDRQDFVAQRLVDPVKTQVLPGEGIDLAHFAPRAAGMPDGKVRFLLIARMLWDKGVGEYIEAARLVRAVYPQAVFQLLGATDVANPSAISAEQMRKWAAEGVVEYLGTTQDVRDIIARADCLVLPSYREGVPRTLLEGAAMAKPLVATKVIGCREVVVDGETGLLCAPRDATDLARKLQHIIEMGPDARATMGARGRRMVEQRYDERIVIERYLEAMRRIGLRIPDMPVA
ncbi:glycosyltransferase family 4 protein [Mycetohabitans sp. B5]|uniref:Glycosyltransferase involved in cell wall biosynthesis n=1 Tax=Mycetohabitans endofungorum TaxID=417203 RepID=A0A2P5KDG8_9BURK|nr:MULTISPECIES: glycosyltransferase family 4 protein [Mycetohabitans]MCG1055893.1 glycosyltransferase family 4 protein [Mycetohabitans sp. B5]PPB84746.1 glycosyltransferase involved in cell wall biosynthesis [Mycetohabitans endofungorum]